MIQFNMPWEFGFPLKGSLKVKIIEKLEIISIIQANIETQHMVFVI